MSPITSLDMLNIGADWPPKGERERLAMYSANRKLFEGQHTDVWSDNTWRQLRLLPNGQAVALAMILNWPKRLSTLWADLLAGDPPTFAINEEGSPEQKQLDLLVERNHFATLLYDIGLDISRYGDGVFKICLKEGEAMIGGQAPSYWFPVVSIADVRDTQYQVLAWPFKARAKSGSGSLRGDEIDMLKVEIHTKGQIWHRVLALGKNGKIEHEENVRAHFEEFTGDTGVELSIIEDTGIDEFLVQQAPGLRPIDRLYGLNDYTDVESVVQEMEVRLGQIARVLDNHADPTAYGPQELIVRNQLTGQDEVPTGGFMPIPDDNPVIPGYLALPDTLSSAFQELEELKLQFYLITETSPAAFGQADAGLATSGTALRRLMQAPLAKARRLRMRLDPVAKKVLNIAMDLENQGKNIGQRGGNAAA